MYFSKITLKPTANRADYAQMVCSNTYKEHQVLWKLFNDDPDAQRDFIYRYEPKNNTPEYYIVSIRKPVDNDYLWDIQSKDYEPVLTSGQQFAFMLRVNPVVTKNGQRHDVVMHLKKNKYPDKKTRPPSQAIVEEAGRNWLTTRAETGGFTFDDSSVRIDGYQPNTSARKKGKKEIRYNMMDFRGILTVTDPDKFKKTLMQGLGKAKAFGCGLMLIRRA